MSGAVAKAETDIAMLIRRNLETVGQTADTKLNAFTDGWPGPHSVLAEAGCKTPPIADWFHIAMRLLHAEQAAVIIAKLVSAGRRIVARHRSLTSCERIFLL